jgi:hypothetical protein
MDLFNPPINYDLTTMSERIKLEEYENPYVQVVWEDLFPKEIQFIKC